MELDLSFVGSGEFVAETVWSCPVHDEPEIHECGCELCTWKEPKCCADADWIDKLDADGNVVMRELSAWDAMFREMAARDGMLSALSEMVLKPSAKVAWLEDTLMPRIGNDDG